MATADTPRLTPILHRLRITTLRLITRLQPLTAIAPVAGVVAIMVAEAVAASTAVVAEVEAPHMEAVVVAADPMAVIINS
jgi:hypothetical protein